MPGPAITLKLKRFRQRFGPAAPRVRVQTHFGWHWYALGVALLVVLVASIVWSVAQHGEVAELRADIGTLRQQNADLGAELEQLRARAGAEQSAVNMERSAQQQLLTRMKLLEQENAALKEDVALFERLVPSDGAEATVRIEKLSVVAATEPDRYRYRLLIGYQPGKQEREFKGQLELHMVLMQAGREIRIALPGSDDNRLDYQIEVRHFLRKEGGFTLPTGTKLKSVEARLVQAGTTRASQIAPL